MAAMRRSHTDAVGIAEMIYWPEVVERWHEDGLPEGQTPGEYFGTDVLGYSIVVDLTLQLEEEMVREDERHILRRNSNGIVHKEIRGSYAPPVEVESLVKDWETWLEYKPGMVADASRIPADYRELYADERRRNCVVLYKNPEPLWATIKMVGYKEALMLLIDEPALLLDTFATYTRLIIEMYEMLEERGIAFDAAWFNGDLCYNTGMLFSPKVYRELLFPFHKQLCDFFGARDMPICTHCCGNLRQIMPLYLEAGIYVFHPLESRVGNDVRELKKQYGEDAVFIGNISAGTLSSTKPEIEAEIESKVTAAKQGGGYIFHSDHSIPPSVSFDNYRYALEMAERYGQY